MLDILYDKRGIAEYKALDLVVELGVGGLEGRGSRERRSEAN
jgi:hypothetical protein